MPAGLATLAVDAQRMTDDRLDAETVEHGAEDPVVVETGGQVGVQIGLTGLLAVDDPLVQVGGPQSPDPTGELDVVAVVDLGQVVEGAGLLRVRKRVGPTLVGDLDETLFDVDVGGSVLAHRAQLDQVDGRITLGDGVQQVEGAHHVVDLGVDGVLAVDHGVGSGTLLGEVHDRLGLETLERAVHEDGISQIADEGIELETRHFFPHPDTVMKLADGNEAVHPHLVVVLPANEIVDHTHVVSPTRQVQRRRPSQIPVTTEHEDPQPCHLLLSAHLCPPGPWNGVYPGPERFTRDSAVDGLPVPVRTRKNRRSVWEEPGSGCRTP